MSKETQKCQKRPRYVKRDLEMSKGTQEPEVTVQVLEQRCSCAAYVERDLEQNQKRPRYVKRDLEMSKGTWEPEVAVQVLEQRYSCAAYDICRKRPRTKSKETQKCHQTSRHNDIAVQVLKLRYTCAKSKETQNNLRYVQRGGARIGHIWALKLRYTCAAHAKRDLELHRQRCTTMPKEIQKDRHCCTGLRAALHAPHMSKETQTYVKRDLEMSKGTQEPEVAVQVFEQRYMCAAHVKRDLGQNQKRPRTISRKLQTYRRRCTGPRAALHMHRTCQKRPRTK